EKMWGMGGGCRGKRFWGIGGIAEFRHALNYFLLGCGTVQVCTAAMLDHAVGPNVVKRLIQGAHEFLDKNAGRFKSLDELRGLRRNRVVAHSQIKRPDESDYQGGYEAEGYAPSVSTADSPSVETDGRPTAGR